MSNESFLGHHSVAVYFVLVFLISWIGSFVAVGSKFLFINGFDFQITSLGTLYVFNFLFRLEFF